MGRITFPNVFRMCIFLVLALPLCPAWAQDDDPTKGAGPQAPWRAVARWDQIDEEATQEIHKYTTDPKYITPMVSYIPQHETVPSPRDFLGYIAGAEGKLTRPKDTIRYFSALAQASPRVSLLEMGTTEEGRTMHLAIITAADNMARLDEFKAYTAALADPRKTDEAQALEIIEKAKPIVHITAGLHSPETGPPEMVMELAYRLAVSNHPDIVDIRNNVVTLITPITEVDGRTRAVEWYYRYLEEYDNRFYMPSRTPPYWGKYTYHDNNRDGIQISQALTKNYVSAYYEWHPTYSLDLHESVPLLYVSGGTGPYNRTLDPIVITEWQWFSSWEMTELNRHGLPGVWTWGFYTGWNPSYLLWVTNNHNSLGRFYETFGNSSARTMERDLTQRKFAGRDITSPEWYRPDPPEKKVVWSLRNNTNYMQSGVLASLTLVSRNGQTLLHNFWKKGENSLRKGREEAPYAWVIPTDQRDPRRLAYLINQLRAHAIEVHQSTSAFTVGETEYKKGDYVVRLDQPYANLARNLLSTQEYPKDSDQRPYDDVSWTLGLHYGVDTKQIDDDAIFEVPRLKLIEEDLTVEGTVEKGDHVAYALKNTGQNALITARYKLKKYKVFAVEKSFYVGYETFPAGSWLISGGRSLASDLADTAKSTGLNFVGLPEEPDVPTHELDLPRLALYHNWISTQNDGWVRFTFEQDGIPYDYINDDDIRAGRLNSKYDVILMAHQGGTPAKSMVHGRDPKFGPQPYTSEDGYESHGVIDSSPDITSGMGFQGMANLESFLDEGGALMLLGSAGRLATDFGLLRNVSTTSGVNTPGSSVQTKIVRPDHPIAYGYKEVDHVYRVNGPVFSVPEQFEHWIVVQYGTKEPESDDDDSDDNKENDDEKKPSAIGKFLLSGYVSGQSELERKGVVLDVPRHAGGRVLLYSFNPLHRYLNHHDHNLIYNAILNWNDFPDAQPKEHPGLAKD